MKKWDVLIIRLKDDNVFFTLTFFVVAADIRQPQFGQLLALSEISSNLVDISNADIPSLITILAKIDLILSTTTPL